MANTVSICGWCPELNILSLQRRDTDAVIIFQRGRALRITRNETVLQVSHGICSACREKHFPDQVGEPIGLEANREGVPGEGSPERIDETVGDA